MYTISVYDGDKPEDLARNFAIEQSLDKKTEKNLLQLIKTQMATVLTRIDEEDNELTENSSVISGF